MPRRRIRLGGRRIGGRASSAQSGGLVGDDLGIYINRLIEEKVAEKVAAELGVLTDRIDELDRAVAAFADATRELSDAATVAASSKKWCHTDFVEAYDRITRSLMERLLHDTSFILELEEGQTQDTQNGSTNEGSSDDTPSLAPSYYDF